MANSKRFFSRLRSLCTRQKYASLVREPTVVSHDEVIPTPGVEIQNSTASECASVPSIDLPLLAINNVLPTSSIATTREPEPEESELKEPIQLVTEDVYDPLIMSFSPKISRQRSEPTKGDACRSPTKGAQSVSETEAPSTGSGNGSDTGFFWYGITLLSDSGTKISSGGDRKSDSSSLDERPSIDLSDDRSPIKTGQCQSSLRYYDLMGHRISDDWTNLDSRVYDALLQYFTGSDPASKRNISKQWSDNVKLLMGKKNG